MPGFDGTGPRGMGPMTGGGRGFCAYPLPANQPLYARNVAYPPYGMPQGMPYGVGPFAPQMSREQELDFLGNQAQALREQLEQIDSRIKQLGSEKE